MIDLTQTPKRLKQSILMEAMQGKLTKQLPSDGNANELLRSIQQKKQKLVNTKKIRNYKLKSININNVSFDIPDNWKLVRLGNIAFLSAGKNLNKYSSTNESPNKSILYIKVADMNSIDNQVVINNSHLYIDDDKYHLPVPSIIFPKIGGAIKTNKRRKVLKSNIYIDPNIMSMTPFCKEMFPFLWRFMKGIDLSKIQSGSAVPALSQKNVNNIIIPVPPLAEQKRIVQRLDQILPKIDGLNRDVVRLHSIRKAFPHRLKQSLLMEAMQGKLTKQLPSDGNADELLQKIQQKKRALIKAGKIRRHKKLPPISKDEIPFEIPQDWKWVRLLDICDYVQKGRELHKDDTCTNGGIPALNQKSIQLDGIHFSYHKKNVKPEVFKKYSKQRLLKSDDILLNCTGTGTVGRSVIISKHFIIKHPKVVADGYIMVIRSCSLIDSEFIYDYLRSFVLKRYIANAVTGATNQMNLNLYAIKPVIVPLPPLSEQIRIIRRLNNLFYDI